MEQIFESENFLLKVDESCQKAFLRLKNLDEFKDESELLGLLQQAGVRQEDLLSDKMSDPHQEFPLAKRPIVPEQAVNYQMEKKGDYVKKGGSPVLAAVSADKNMLNCFGDKDYYVDKYVKENFLGENTYFENGLIYSGKDGCPYQDQRQRLNVRDKFTVNGDLVQEVEEPFYGDLEVFGNVLNTQIEVVGKLVVHGSISASQVKVHDILVVHNNVMEYSRVEVCKDASMAAATNSTIICGGNVFFNTGLTACRWHQDVGATDDGKYHGRGRRKRRRREIFRSTSVGKTTESSLPDQKQRHFKDCQKTREKRALPAASALLLQLPCQRKRRVESGKNKRRPNPFLGKQLL